GLNAPLSPWMGAPRGRACAPSCSRADIAERVEPMAWFLPVAWVVAMPFAFAALMATSPRANAFAGRHLETLLSVGVLGVMMLIAGAMLVRHDAGRAMLALGAPLAGL